MSVVSFLPKLNLRFQICSPKTHAQPSQKEKIEQIRLFWKTHWAKTFQETGAPDEGWQDHFDRQDMVVALTLESKVIGCHLYTFYDLNQAASRESDYFAYFQKTSIDAFIENKVPRVMTMEYLGVSPSVSQNAEHLSIGKLLVALATYAANEAGADAVVGTPINTTKVAQMMDNVHSLTLEEKIEKYGYTLSLKYASVNPWRAGLDTKVAARADEIWRAREVINELPQFGQKKQAA